MLNQLPRELLLEQVNNGLILLVLGMGVVFLFLTLLVFTTKLLSFTVNRYFPQKVSTAPVKRMASSVNSAHEAQSGEIVAAITAALARSKR
ncbi:MAG: sodium pump decarboxylase subunit gamma [Spirochaetia bacterium]|nr:sodium pump decarboxylase subunit gamma [Spirochaetia bacterium]